MCHCPGYYTNRDKGGQGGNRDKVRIGAFPFLPLAWWSWERPARIPWGMSVDNTPVGARLGR